METFDNILRVPEFNRMAAKRGPIGLGMPYYMPMSIPLTGTAGENITGQTTQNYLEEVIIRAGVTDLETSQVLFSKPGTIPQLWSQAQVPVASLMGQVDSARPYLRYPYPTRLRVGEFLQAQVLNVQGEQAGTFVFICDQPLVEGKPNAVDPQRLSSTQVIPIDSQFTGTIGEQTNSGGVLNPVDYDFLLLGFYTDLSFAQVQIIDVWGRQWMSGSTAAGATNACPIWAVAGRNNSQQWIQYLPRPYLVPKFQMIQVNFTNVTGETSGQLYMFGQRLLDKPGAETGGQPV